MKLLRDLFGSKGVDPLDTLADDYLKRLKRGEKIDRSSFIATYPELAVELGRRLDANPEIVAAEEKLQKQFPGPMGLATRGAPDGVPDFSIEEAPKAFDGMKLGDYEIASEIGRGAMGRVYRARKVGSSQDVALKTLPASLDISDGQMARLGREGSAQGRLNHPNIVKVYDSGTCDEIPYLCMELIEGGETLQTLLEKTGKRFEERRAAEIILALAHALAYSHQQDVVHRDIKPSNIMMDGDTPKLTDFGLAFIQRQDVTRLTQSGEMLGTLCYMSPEQVGGHQSDGSSDPHPQCDVYSLGATLYELLTGELPFVAETPGQLIKKVIDDDPLPPEKMGAKVSKDIEAICIKCLEKSPEKRYYTASALGDDLTRYLDGRRVEAPRINWATRRLRNYVSKRRWAVAASFFLILTLSGTFAVTYIFNYRDGVKTLVTNNGNAPPEGDDYKLSLLLRAVNDDQLEARMAAVTALCRQDNDEARAALIKAAEDPEEKVRFHLATVLVDWPGETASRVCKLLLEEDGGFVAAAAIKLADTIGDSRFTPAIKKFTYSDEKVLRGYALGALMTAPGLDYDAFVSEYFRDGPKDGRIALLKRFMKAKAAPSIPPLIQLLEGTGSSAEIESASKILAFFTDGSYGSDSQQWRIWWEKNGESWHARRCLAVSWASQESLLKLGDIIWEIDGNEVTRDAKFSPSLVAEIGVIRKDTFNSINGPLGAHKSQAFFIGTVNGLPVGDNALAGRLAKVLSSGR